MCNGMCLFAVRVCAYFREEDSNKLNRLERHMESLDNKMESLDNKVSRLESHMCRLMHHLKTKMSLGDQEPLTQEMKP